MPFWSKGPAFCLLFLELLLILASHFRARVETPEKNPTWGLA